MLGWVLIALVIVVFVFRRKKHMFWGHQPVSRDALRCEGMISHTHPQPIDVKNPDRIVTVEPLKHAFHRTLADFLSRHYVKDYRYDSHFISWVLNFPYMTRNNIINLFQNDTLTGNIISKPYRLHVRGIPLHSQYVDMLCVHKGHRNKNYAPVLISQLLKHSFIGDHKTYIYKIEQKPLPFNYICKARYYFKRVDDSTTSHVCRLRRTTTEDIEYIRTLYDKESVKYACFPSFDTNQMKYMCTSVDSVYESLVIDVGGENRGIVMFSINDLRHGRGKVAEISLLLCENSYHIEAVKALIQYCHAIKVNVVLCTNIGQNHAFVKSMDFSEGMDVYFHMYNYHLNKPLEPRELLFNFV